MTVLDRYLRRLGLATAPAPTHDALVALHRAHVERVPWQSLHVQLDERTGVDGAASARRIAEGRSGYCMHLNGGFSWLLEQLGYAVTRRRAGVQVRDGEPVVDDHHVGLVVTGLPTEEHPAGDWLVDVGLGDALHEPLPLRAGVHEQGAWRFRLTGSTVAPGGWRLEHDERGSFAAVDVSSEVVAMAHFEAAHREMAESPDGFWRTWAVVERRHATGLDRLVGLELTQHVGSSRTVTVLAERPQWEAALREVLRFEVDLVPPTALERLWQRLRAAQDEREAAAV